MKELKVLEPSQLHIGVVGACAAGKTTMINEVSKHGFNARHIAQEHSYVQDMWRKMSNPDVLIYLDVSYANTLSRRNLNWTEQEYETQNKRLAHARQNADQIVNTNDLSSTQVLEQCLSFLNSIGTI